MTCIQPYLNVKAYYDETNSMFKYYEKNAIYNNIAGEESSIFWEKYTFVEYDADTEYTKVVYDVEEKSKSTVSAGAEYGLDFTYSIRPLNYYKRIYNQINSDEVAISFNKVDETTVEYTINDYKNNVVVRCTFVNGMLEKYVLASFEAGYGEPTHHGIVEVDIKYSCDDMTIADVESYTEVTE